jgi:hypothetical protein
VLSLFLAPVANAVADDSDPPVALVCNAGCNQSCGVANGSCIGGDYPGCQRGTTGCKDCRCVGTQWTPPPIEEIIVCDCKPRY